MKKFDFVGEWKAVDDDVTDRFKFSLTKNGQLKLSVVDDGDGEKLVVKNFKQTAQTVAFQLYVPSTGVQTNRYLVGQRSGDILEWITTFENWIKLNKPPVGRTRAKQYGLSFDGTWVDAEGYCVPWINIAGFGTSKLNIKVTDCVTAERAKISKLKVTPRTISFESFFPASKTRAKHHLVFKNHKTILHKLTTIMIWCKVGITKSNNGATGVNS